MRRLGKLSRKRLIETAELFHADAKLAACIVRSEFSEFSITARLKRLQAAASRQKRLPPRANHDQAREDEHGGDAHCGCEVHGRAKPQCIQSKFRSLP
jgi:hypothetical protein